MNSFRENDNETGSLIKMIDDSRKSHARAVIDISFSNVQKNGEISELLAYLTDVKMREEPLYELQRCED